MNSNPILLDKIPDSPTEFKISKKHSATMIYLTLKVNLLDEGWLFASAHSVFLKLKNLYPEKTPEPTDLKLDYANALDDSILFIRSHVSRFRDGSEGDKPSRVEYKLTIEAGDVLLDEFILTSNNENPSDFNSSIKFKLQ